MPFRMYPGGSGPRPWRAAAAALAWTTKSNDGSNTARCALGGFSSHCGMILISSARDHAGSFLTSPLYHSSSRVCLNVYSSGSFSKSKRLSAPIAPLREEGGRRPRSRSCSKAACCASSADMPITKGTKRSDASSAARSSGPEVTWYSLSRMASSFRPYMYSAKLFVEKKLLTRLLVVSNWSTICPPTQRLALMYQAACTSLVLVRLNHTCSPRSSTGPRRTSCAIKRPLSRESHGPSFAGSRSVFQFGPNRGLAMSLNWSLDLGTIGAACAS